MANVIVGQLDHQESADRFSAELRDILPGRAFGCGEFAHPEGGLAEGATRFVFVMEGNGEAFLPAGFRTKEGDGDPLPPAYEPDPPTPELREAMRLLHDNLTQETEARRRVLEGVLARWSGSAFVGDVANELWQIEEYSLFPEAPGNQQAVRWLRTHYREIGYSTRAEAGWEPLQGGDALVVPPGKVLRVRGRFRGWWLDDLSGVRRPHLPLVRRVRHLRDTAGGCNFAFDAYRRLPLTWYMPISDEPTPDGPNRLNSHIVNIPEETSRTHYHPNPAVGGGDAQHELYLVLGHAALGLSSHGRRAQLHVYPEAPDYSRWQTIDLRPGTMCLIPPPVAHRGSNALVNVVTLPGFKPHNELYIDEQIAAVAPQAPVNVLKPVAASDAD